MDQNYSSIKELENNSGQQKNLFYHGNESEIINASSTDHAQNKEDYQSEQTSNYRLENN